SRAAHRGGRRRIFRRQSVDADRRARARGGSRERRPLIDRFRMRRRFRSAAQPPITEPASVPVEPREGLAPVAVTDAHEAAQLVSEPLGATIARVALPAVASSLLMTLFASVDAFWVGTRIGPAGLAAVATSIFWVWCLIAIAEMVSIGLTAVAARRYGEGRGDAAARAAGSALVFTLVAGAVVAALG